MAEEISVNNDDVSQCDVSLHILKLSVVLLIMWNPQIYPCSAEPGYALNVGPMYYWLIIGH